MNSTGWKPKQAPHIAMGKPRTEKLFELRMCSKRGPDRSAEVQSNRQTIVERDVDAQTLADMKRSCVYACSQLQSSDILSIADACKIRCPIMPTTSRAVTTKMITVFMPLNLCFGWIYAYSLERPSGFGGLGLCLSGLAPAESPLQLMAQRPPLPVPDDARMVQV